MNHASSDCDELDLLVTTNGGDGSMASQAVAMIREHVSHFSVLVCDRAKSAGTLLALGADEIIMHPHACLGPIDPQVTHDSIKFSSDDIAARSRNRRALPARYDRHT